MVPLLVTLSLAPSLQLPHLVLQPDFRNAKIQQLLRAEDLVCRVMKVRPELNWKSLQLKLKLESKTDWTVFFTKKF